MATKKSTQSQQSVVVNKVFYNIIRETRTGDKFLEAQTTTPREYVDMVHPAAMERDGSWDEEIIWEIEDQSVIIYAIMIRPMTFTTLLTEEDFNKMRRV